MRRPRPVVCRSWGALAPARCVVVRCGDGADVCRLQVFSCNGSIVKDTELGEVLQLSGDQRDNVAKFLTEEGICKKEDLKIHGF